MTVLGSFAAYFLKRAAALKSVKQMILNINIYLGGGLYFLSALLNIYLLNKIDYSVVLPLTSITYIWTMIISYYILKEKITIKKIIGIAGIFVGALFVVS